MPPTKIIKCDECEQDLTGKIQVYTKDGRVLCERDNWREGEKEVKRDTI
ncbi:LIM domain-containing protein [Novosphingobium aquae]